MNELIPIYQNRTKDITIYRLSIPDMGDGYLVVLYEIVRFVNDFSGLRKEIMYLDWIVTESQIETLSKILI